VVFERRCGCVSLLEARFVRGDLVWVGGDRFVVGVCVSVSVSVSDYVVDVVDVSLSLSVSLRYGFYGALTVCMIH
jgi:hypothetical protein